ncbi:Nif3-like dinuclear metal center hexameric protein [Gudongella sp. DL1XJH-153]|uniref:Nif3-like dinuclear metal center hexameric protein n=1 Tax=Gudongella sp. DL1XJH-153 TaxID=3409804 RepID=UPI003BB49FE7
MKALDIVSKFEQWVPLNLVDSWDNTGLQIGDPEQLIKGIIISMDVTEDVVEEAIREQCNMIVTHHPFIFRPMDNLVLNTYKGRLIKRIISNDILIYNAHTNLDLAVEGINDQLALIFGMKNTETLSELSSEELVKVAVYVPETHQNKILEALSESDAGHIGNYSECSFTVRGTGRFKPQAGSNPFLGSTGRLESVAEVRIETIVKKDLLQRTMDMIKEEHPYEEVAFDIFPILNKGKGFGYGRVGNIEDCTLKELAESTKALLNLDEIRVYGSDKGIINRIAVCGGAGSDFIRDAARKGAQVYITGDIKYHDAQLAYEEGIVIIDGTHYGTESIILPVMERKLVESTHNSIKIKIHEDRSFHFACY